MSAVAIIYAAAVLILATSTSLCIGTLVGAWITYAARTGINPIGGLTDQAKKLFSRAPKPSEPEPEKVRGPLAKP